MNYLSHLQNNLHLFISVLNHFCAAVFPLINSGEFEPN